MQLAELVSAKLSDGSFLLGQQFTSISQAWWISAQHRRRRVVDRELPNSIRPARSVFDMLIACVFNYEAHATEFSKLGRIPVLKALTCR